jgi:hypothetical protein
MAYRPSNTPIRISDRAKRMTASRYCHAFVTSDNRSVRSLTLETATAPRPTRQRPFYLAHSKLAASSIPKKLLEPLRRQGRIARRVLDVAVTEIGLDRTGVVAVVGELIAAGMPEQGGCQDAEIDSDGLYCGRPDGKPHFVPTRSTLIDANSCVASLRKPLDTRYLHHFAAAAPRLFGRAGHQQTLKSGHLPSKRRHEPLAQSNAAVQLRLLRVLQ